MDRYAKNSRAVFSLKYHLLWCPKYRRPVLTGPVERRLKALLRLKAKEIGITIHALEIMPDHVHLFVESDPTRCMAEIAARFKGFTSHVLGEEFHFLRSRLPTLLSRSYLAATVGRVTETAVSEYIDGQKGK